MIQIDTIIALARQAISSKNAEKWPLEPAGGWAAGDQNTIVFWTYGAGL
jgi:hypothetical protein